MNTMHRIGFIGAGRITRILLEGLRRRAALPPRVQAFDCHPAPAALLQQRVPEAEIVRDPKEIAAADLVFLAVHPPALPDAAAAIKHNLNPDAVVASLAPKWSLSRLAELLGGFNRLVRIIPNAPSLIGAGFNPIAYAPNLSPEAREAVARLLRPLGACPVVPEKHLEAYAVLAAMGPTYFWFQWQTLRELATEFGLPEPAASEALRSMIDGALQVWLESGSPPNEVMDLVPVKPLAELEPVLTEAYRETLTAVYQKITS